MDSLTSIWPPATTKNAGGFAGVCRRLQEFAGFAGFQIDNRLKDLNGNYEKCFKKVHKISRSSARYRLSLKGRITIAKTFFLPQFTYVA